MSTATAQSVPQSPHELAERFGDPDQLAVKHKLPYIDEAAARFLEQCPFVIVSTADTQGRCDASPKGDPPGFIKSQTNTPSTSRTGPVTRCFRASAIFWRTRTSVYSFSFPARNGLCASTAAPGLPTNLSSWKKLSARGRPAQLAIEVSVEECYFHCPKSFKRAELWNAEKFHTYEGDSWGAILAQRTEMEKRKAAELDTLIEESVKNL